MQGERPGCTQVHQMTVLLVSLSRWFRGSQLWFYHSISKEPTAACKQCVCAFKEENGHQKYQGVHRYSDILKIYSFCYNVPTVNCNSHFSRNLVQNRRGLGYNGTFSFILISFVPTEHQENLLKKIIKKKRKMWFIVLFHFYSV